MQIHVGHAGIAAAKQGTSGSFGCGRWLPQACKLPAVLEFSWWQIPVNWLPVEILFQRQLPTGASVPVPTPALYSIPSVSYFWLLTKSPHAVAYSQESVRVAREQHGGWWHSPSTASPRAGKPALPWAGLAPHRCRRALQPPQPVRTTCSVPPRMYVTSVGAVWFVGWGCRQAQERARFSARAAARAGEHPPA